MYTTSIFMLLSWPLLIILCWLAVRIAVIIYENIEEKSDTPSEQ
jgi:hypothetical protein